MITLCPEASSILLSTIIPSLAKVAEASLEEPSVISGCLEGVFQGFVYCLRLIRDLLGFSLQS